MNKRPISLLGGILLFVWAGVGLLLLGYPSEVRAEPDHQLSIASAPQAEADERVPAVDAHAVPKSAAHDAGPGLLDFDPWILLAQILNFFLLLFILKKLFFGPIQQILDDRSRKIGHDLLAAEEAHAKADLLRKDLEERLAKAEEEAYRIRQEAVAKAQQAREEILAEAREKVAKRVAGAEQEILLEKQRAWAQLRENVVLLTMQAAEKVVEASLDDDMHRHLIANTIDKLERTMDEERR